MGKHRFTNLFFRGFKMFFNHMMVILNGIFNGRSSCHMGFPVFSHQIKGVSGKCPINQGILGRFIPPTLLEQKKGTIYAWPLHHLQEMHRDATLQFVSPSHLFFLSFKSIYTQKYRSNCLSNLVYNLSTSSNQHRQYLPLKWSPSFCPLLCLSSGFSRDHRSVDCAKETRNQRAKRQVVIFKEVIWNSNPTTRALYLILQQYLYSTG